MGHDWGAFAAYGAARLKPERFTKVVAMAAPPVAAVASTFFSYDQVKRSFYVFFFQSPLAEPVVSCGRLQIHLEAVGRLVAGIRRHRGTWPE